MFFDEKGILNIDEIVVNNPSFKQMMSDGIITEEEIKEQSEKVISMLKNLEAKLSAEQLKEVENLLAESSVLYAIYNYYSIQENRL